MLRILDLAREPSSTLAFTAVRHGGGRFAARLPVLEGRAAGLPPGLAALVLTADLEGVHEPADGPPVALGVALATRLASRFGDGRGRVGVVLAGDLFGEAGDRVRGRAGDVRPVWRAFAARFRWVAGVAGNHDRFGGAAGRAALAAEPGVYDLDAGPAAPDGLRLAGVGGVADARPKPGHRPPAEFARALAAAAAAAPHLLVLHSTPRLPRKRFGGCPEVAAALAALPPMPVVAGHKHWDRPLGERPGGGQVLNVDRRVVVLRPA